MGVAPSHLELLSPPLPRAEALGRCNPDQRAPSPALAKEDVLYATRPKPPAQLIRATRSRAGAHLQVSLGHLITVGQSSGPLPISTSNSVGCRSAFQRAFRERRWETAPLALSCSAVRSDKEDAPRGGTGEMNDGKNAHPLADEVIK